MPGCHRLKQKYPQVFKKTFVLTSPPQRAKTRFSPNKAAASEETKRILSHPARLELLLAALARWYVESLSDATCLREALRRRQGTPLAAFSTPC